MPKPQREDIAQLLRDCVGQSAPAPASIHIERLNLTIVVKTPKDAESLVDGIRSALKASNDK